MVGKVAIFGVFMGTFAAGCGEPLGGSDDQDVEQVVLQYLRDHDPGITRGSPEYMVFLKDILWGLHPDLLNHSRGTKIGEFAAAYISNAVAPLLDDEQAPRPTIQSQTSALTSGFNRNAVVNYAYAWASNGGKKRNGAYVSFDNDCTNFASQAIKAGGVPAIGSGSCGYEETTWEWYSQFSLAWWCLKKWAVSTTWVRVSEFYQYHVQNKRNASTGLYYLGNLNSLRSAARPGDIIQLQLASSGTLFHSMVVTKKDSTGEIYCTYHTGPNGYDVVDKPLASIAANYGNTSYYRLNRFD
ncbi:hypothetical protein EPN28_01800 [Patescibacteria group bacterium]|nr:MAG: hypothetical protein EPN28_01800 [Patescibacteria group bacterium]